MVAKMETDKKDAMQVFIQIRSINKEKGLDSEFWDIIVVICGYFVFLLLNVIKGRALFSD